MVVVFRDAIKKPLSSSVVINIFSLYFSVISPCKCI